ncbi:MAG: chloride channel protein family [Solirubrobacteraceae bacterium]|nr:chloride channel protein family [Solirubrobacteraceae bacterium]
MLLSALTGVLTGAGVALFEWVTRAQLFERLVELPTAVQVVAPLVGLLLAAGIIRFLGGGDAPATADEYIKNFHDQGRRLPLGPVPARLLASVATLGLGGSMGYEGPSVYLGAAIGSGLQQRLSRFFSREDAKVLLVCGAAAGVAAIFKAPATGLVFALEVPYQEDVARRMLLPAGIAAAASYVTFVSFAGTAPLFAVRGAPPFNLRDLGGAALLGVTCGVGARLYTQALVGAKALASRTSPVVRAAVAGSGLAGLAALSFAVFDRGLTLGAGYDNLEWAFDPKRAVGLVVLLLTMRAAATVLTVAGGGAGGLFIPLVVEGALIGRAMGGLFRTAASGANFFPLVGVSAFLGAGYRVPLAGVMFAAEATGRPGFIVPGVIASVVAQLFMGRSSASPYQVATRAGHLERRFVLPLTTALRTDVPTAPPDTTIEEFVWQHLLGNRQQEVPVVDGGTFVGMMRIDEAVGVARESWATEHVSAHMREDFPTIHPGALLRDALEAMERADVDSLPVVDGTTFVGIVTTDEILRLDEILGRAEG